MFSQISFGREVLFTEATLRNGTILVQLVSTHFAYVFAQMGETTKCVSTLITLEGSEVVMTGSYVHGQGGIMTECNTTSERKKITNNFRYFT